MHGAAFDAMLALAEGPQKPRLLSAAHRAYSQACRLRYATRTKGGVFTITKAGKAWVEAERRRISIM